MKKNQIIKILEEYVGTDYNAYVSGEVYDVGTPKCNIDRNFGSVYGFAIRINSEQEKQEIFKKIKSNENAFAKDKKITSVDEWKEIGDCYYPLYWGKDSYSCVRIVAHTKSYRGVGSIRLDSLHCLKDYKNSIIFGSFPCTNIEKHEEELHRDYPDILKTSKPTKKKATKIKMISLKSKTLSQTSNLLFYETKIFEIDAIIIEQ